MNKSFETVIFSEETVPVRFDVLDDIIKKSKLKLCSKDVIAIYELCVQCIVDEKKEISLLGIYLYRTYAEEYLRVFRTYCNPKKISEVMENEEYKLKKRLLWLAESVSFIQDKSDPFVIINKPIVKEIVDKTWSPKDDWYGILPCILDIYTAWPFLLSSVDEANLLRKNIIDRIVSIQDFNTYEVIAFMTCMKPFAELLWKDCTKDELVMSAVQIITILAKEDLDTDKPCKTHSSVSAVFPSIVDVFPDAIDHFISLKEGNDKLMKNVLTIMIKWTLVFDADGVTISRVVVAIVKHLYESGHGDVPYSVTKTFLSIISTRVLITSQSISLLTIFKTLALSCRRSPGPFHSSVLVLIELFNLPEDKMSDAHKQVLQQLSFISYCLMDEFPGYPAFYKPLTKAMKGYPKPSLPNIEKELGKYNWEKSPKTEKYFVERISLERGTFKHYHIYSTGQDNYKLIEARQIRDCCRYMTPDDYGYRPDRYEQLRQLEISLRHTTTDLLVADFCELSITLNRKLNTSCYYFNHNLNIRKRIADQHLTKLLSWE